jgi:hypothetical protein
MVMSVDEWRGIMMVVGNQARVSAIRSELVPMPRLDTSDIGVWQGRGTSLQWHVGPTFLEWKVFHG